MSPIASSDPYSALSSMGNLTFPSRCAFVPRARSWSMRLPDCSFQVHARPSNGSWLPVLAAIDISFGCASLFPVLFGSPFPLPNWSRIPLLADQVLDLATAIVCPTSCFLPSPRLIPAFACGKGYGRLGMAGMFERMRSEQCQHPGRRSSGDSATSMVAVHLHSDTAWHPLLCKDLNEVWIFLEESTQPLKIS